MTPVSPLRAAALAKSSVEYAEAEILHFDKDEYYGTHHDYTMVETINDPQRFVVITVFLNAVTAGGQVAFPGTNFALSNKKHKYLEPIVCTSEDPETWKMVPKPGAATLHYILSEDGHTANALDHYAVRFDCPVEKGEKWAINFFFYNRRPNVAGAPSSRGIDELPTTQNPDGSINVDASV